MKEKNSPSFFDVFVLPTAFLMVFAGKDIFFPLGGVILYALTGKDLAARGVFFQRCLLIAFSLGIVFLLILFERFLLRRIRKKYLYGLLFLILLIPVIQTLIICANQVLRRDDYWEIADANTYGFPGSMFFEIRNHNGRYLSWGIKSAYAFLPPIPFINILLFINICLMMLGFFLLINQILSDIVRIKRERLQIRVYSLLMAMALTAMVILLSSKPWEVWFWGSGTWVYGLTISLCVLSLALTVGITSGSYTGPYIRILTAVLCFLTCGGSELSTASLGIFLFFLILCKRIVSKTWDKAAIFYFCEVAVCCLGILLMSGSITAAEEFAEAGISENGFYISRLPEMFRSIIISLWRYSTGNGWNLFLFLLVFLMFGTLFRVCGKKRKQFALVSLLLIFTANVIPLINMFVEYAPSRVYTASLCWTYSALALLCFSTGSFLAEKFVEHKTESLLLLSVLLICFSFNMFYRENIGLLRQIRQSWLVRNESLLQEFDRDTTVSTCVLPTIGSSGNDLGKDPAELFNIAMRMYLRVPAVTAEKMCPPFDQESE